MRGGESAGGDKKSYPTAKKGEKKEAMSMGNDLFSWGGKSLNDVPRKRPTHWEKEGNSVKIQKRKVGG